MYRGSGSSEPRPDYIWRGECGCSYFQTAVPTADLPKAQFQITLFLASVPVLLKLRRAINEDMCAVEGGEGDVPLGWHVPPEQFAPDSSESESDGHVRTRLLGRRAQSQDHHGLVHGRGHSWTEFKKQRSREAGVIRIS